MRLIAASVLIQLMFAQNFLAIAESEILSKQRTHQNKNYNLVMIKAGGIDKLSNDEGRTVLSENLHSFRTVGQKRIADHNRARLDHYRSRLEKYTPPKGELSILVTGYSSTPDQTWGDPFTTASGTKVHRGTMACPPQYPFGTKVDIRSMGTYVCEDRGGAIKGNHFDMWFESRAEAINWGKRVVSAEIKK